MSNNARRVVLLARPGEARERMREALGLAGANIVLEADPTTTQEAEVLGARPDAALIVLDAATDEALDRYDSLLSDPKVEVFFEEAEHAVGRVGWDAARWVRHLSAKLHHSDDVLPPGRADGASPVAAAPSLPADTSAEDRAVAPAEPAVPPPLPEPVPPVAEAPAPIAASGLGSLSLEPMGDDAPAEGAEAAPSATIAEPPPFQPTPVASAAPAEITAPPVKEPAAFEFHSDLELVGLEFDEDATRPAAAPTGGNQSPFMAKFELELADEAPTSITLEGLETAEEAPRETSGFHSDMAELHTRMAALELVEDRVAATVHGVVLVLAGIGGPDAVRQLLGALPTTFPRPVLIQQRLDGGHYDKLVAQMQRATALPVRLATAGDAVQPTTVYILPPTIGVRDGDSGLTFVESESSVLVGLPAGDSAVLMLSGSDPEHVDAVMKLGAAGAMIAAQALDGCYDVAAPAALAARGGQAGKPQELAKRLTGRWH